MDYDHVIIGAGSAGCVLANRLSANASRRVLLIEAGPRDWHPFIHMPAGLGILARSRAINWDYRIEPEPALHDRRVWWPRGKVLGGSSSINAMCFVRGAPEDYDDWAHATGDERWAWPNALAHFKRMESNSRGAGPWHGGDGPQGVSDLRHHNELSAALIEAAAAAGFPRNGDFNGANQEGFGYYQVSQRNGARCSTARAYLAPAMARRNLEVRTGTLCRRVLVERGRAIGVEVERRGRIERIDAGEVIVSGGSINSPQLLMLSGIGPADHLREHDIAVAADLPGVGENLSDHLDVSTLVRCIRPVTYDGVSTLAVGLRYLFTRSGIGTSNIAECGGFMRSRFAPDRRCDLQFHFVPALLNDRGRSDRTQHGYTLHVCYLQPRSRGRIRLRSADPAMRAAIFAGYLSDPEGHDLAMLVEGVAVSRQILAQAPLDPYRGEECLPGSDAVGRDEVEDFIRRNARTIYHPVGTCRMGRDARRGDRSATAGARHRGAARGGCLDHAGTSLRQHQCADHHDRGSRIRPDAGRKRLAPRVGQHRRQRAAQRGADHAQQFGFREADFAVGCDRTRQRTHAQFLAFRIQARELFERGIQRVLPVVRDRVQQRCARQRLLHRGQEGATRGILVVVAEMRDQRAQIAQRFLRAVQSQRAGLEIRRRIQRGDHLDANELGEAILVEVDAIVGVDQRIERGDETLQFRARTFLQRGKRQLRQRQPQHRMQLRHLRRRIARGFGQRGIEGLRDQLQLTLQQILLIRQREREHRRHRAARIARLRREDIGNARVQAGGEPVIVCARRADLRGDGGCRDRQRRRRIRQSGTRQRRGRLGSRCGAGAFGEQRIGDSTSPSALAKSCTARWNG